MILLVLLCHPHTPARATRATLPPRTLPTVPVRRGVSRLLVTLSLGRRGRDRRHCACRPLPVLPAKRLVGSDIAHAVPLTLLGGLGHLGLGNMDAGLLVALVCGSIPRHSHRRAACRSGAGMAAQADPRADALLRGLHTVQQGLSSNWLHALKIVQRPKPGDVVTSGSHRNSLRDWRGLPLRHVKLLG